MKISFSTEFANQKTYGQVKDCLMLPLLAAIVNMHRLMQISPKFIEDEIEKEQISCISCQSS